MTRSFASGAAAWILAAALPLAACDFAPDYHVPETAAPLDYKETADWKLAHPSDELPKGEWWKGLGDPRLDDLEDKIGVANQNLKSAYARFMQARAALGISEADLSPQVGLNTSYSKTQASKNAIPLTKPSNYSNYAISANVSYEVDLWGRVKNSVEAAKDSALASEGDLAAVDLDLKATLAADYFSLRGFDTQQRILDETVAAYQSAFDLINRRHSGGVQPIADVAQAQGQLETAKTQAADNHLRRQQMEHAIAILVGLQPAEFDLAALPLDTKAPPPIGTGLPSQLLERRPDIAAAERRVASANAQIGVARAAYYPAVTLDGLLGTSTSAPAKLFQAPSTIWSFGPSAALALIDGGRRDAQNDQARAFFDQTVADYRQTVLNASGEVEDNLVALHQLDRESLTQATAVSATQTALDQAKLRYNAGLVTYIEVVDTQNLALQAQLSAADIQTRRMTSTVQLIKALGGGWDAATGLDLDMAARTQLQANAE
jgi:NodT family efflux transporter outer membrane factor (OMF) lipoprotein